MLVSLIISRFKNPGLHNEISFIVSNVLLQSEQYG